MKSTKVWAKQGTIKHKAAMGTLTFIDTDGTVDVFSDLGLASIWKAYQNRLAELTYNDKRGGS